MATASAFRGSARGYLALALLACAALGAVAVLRPPEPGVCDERVAAPPAPTPKLLVERRFSDVQLDAALERAAVHLNPLLVPNRAAAAEGWPWGGSVVSWCNFVSIQIDHDTYARHHEEVQRLLASDLVSGIVRLETSAPYRERLRQ